MFTSRRIGNSITETKVIEDDKTQNTKFKYEENYNFINY